MKKLFTIAIVLGLFLALLGSNVVVSAQEGTPEEPLPTESVEPVDSDGDGVLDDADLCPETPEGTEVDENGCPVEPTAEPTEEATEEPTVEPTEEPTVEPTEEPTAEPTEEPTVEPTEEPTAEPTEEPTLVPEEVSPQHNVGGSWTSEYIGIQNLGSGVARAILDLYQGSATPVQSIEKNNIPVGGSVLIRSSEISANGQYAGIVTSDQLMAAAVININSSGTVGDAYLGHNAPSNRQTLPIVFRDHSLWESTFYIQNATSTVQTVTVRAYRVGSGTASASPTYDIPGNSSITVDFMSSAFDAFGSGDGAYGYVVVEGGGNIAVLCRNINDYPTAIIEMYYRGFNDNEAARELVVPVVYNMHSQWESGTMVVNMSGQTTDVKMTYYEDSQYYGGGTYEVTKTLGPNQAVDFTLRYTAGLPQPSFGSAKFTSSNSNANILAIANSVTYPASGSTGFSGPALNPTLATAKVAAPVSFNRGMGDLYNWNTGIGVYCVGAGGTVTTRWVRAGTNPTVSYTAQKTCTANAITTFWAPELTTVPADFDGAVYIEAAQPVMALVNTTWYAQGISCQMPGYNY